MQRQPRNKKVLLLKVWATYHAANHGCVRLRLVHVALSPGRQSVAPKLRSQGATNLKRMMKMNCKTSIFAISPFGPVVNTTLMLFNDVSGNYSLADYASYLSG